MLKKIEPGKNRYDTRRATSGPSNRKAAADAGGISDGERKTMRGKGGEAASRYSGDCERPPRRLARSVRVTLPLPAPTFERVIAG
jgi:hypothetical protein